MTVKILVLSCSEYSCSNEKLASLSGSYIQDANLIYGAVEAAAYENFDATQSSINFNVKSEEARMLIQIFSKRSNHDDVLIVYFSGHGTLFKDKLSLHFADSDAECDGQLLSDEITTLIHKYGKGEFLLIIDSCHSGGAETAVISDNIYFQSKISLIASCDAFYSDKKGLYASRFTEKIVTVIYKLIDSGNKVSYDSIINELNKYKSLKFHPMKRSGPSDIILSSKLEDIESSLGIVFFRELLSSPSIERSSLWYLLADAPEKQRVNILQDGRNHSVFDEPTWLVRRAIGSCIDSIQIMRYEKIELVLYLLGSSVSTSECVGLIGGRNIVSKNEKIENKYRQCLLSEDMDVVWLASLYLSDHNKLKYNDYLDLYTNKFGVTMWGAFELLKMSVKTDAYHRIRDNILTDHGSVTYCREYLDYINNKLLPSQIHNSTCFIEFEKEFPVLAELFHFLPRSKTGRTGSEKLFFSKMYGNWRNQYSHQFDRVFQNVKGTDLASIVKFIGEFSDISLKLAFLESIQKTIGVINGKVDMEIFLKDKHPWVRREAIRTLLNNRNVVQEASEEDFKKFIFSEIDHQHHPGGIELGIAILFYYNNSDCSVQFCQDFLHISKERIDYIINHNNRERLAFSI